MGQSSAELLADDAREPLADRLGLVRARRLGHDPDQGLGPRRSQKNPAPPLERLGLAPKHMDALLGKRVARKVARGTPMSWDLVERDEQREANG